MQSISIHATATEITTVLWKNLQYIFISNSFDFWFASDKTSKIRRALTNIKNEEARKVRLKSIFFMHNNYKLAFLKSYNLSMVWHLKLSLEAWILKVYWTIQWFKIQWVAVVFDKSIKLTAEAKMHEIRSKIFIYFSEAWITKIICFKLQDTTLSHKL